MKALFEKVGKIGPGLSECIEEEEKNRRISGHTFNALKAEGLYNLFKPESLGGFQADPVTTAKLVEEIARYNTAAGWSMMVANTSCWWCNRLTKEGVEDIFRNGDDTFIAGAFHPPMRATPVSGGYKINGRSPLTSNVHEAQWIFVSALVMDGEQPKMNNGMPEVLGVFISAPDCEIIDTWQTLGMKATDSNDVAARDVFVPLKRSYTLTPEFEPSSYFSDCLYRFPAIGASVASLIAPIALAVAMNAIAEVKILADKKTPFGSMVSINQRGVVQRKLGMAEALVQSSRAYLHHALAESWKKTQAGERLSNEERASLLLAITHTNQSCVQAVDLMYSVAGSTGIYLKNKLSRYFMDAQVIRHHGFANESRYETAGQVYFGLQPDLIVMMF